MNNRMQQEAAAEIKKAAAVVAGRTGWVLISHLANEMGASNLEAFKLALLGLHEANLLTLCRADMTAAMNPADVRASHLRDGLSDYHLVRF